VNIDLALSLVIALINNAAAISNLIQTAKAEGRDITPAELQALFDADALARAKLEIAISEAKAAGR
jgi:hypothetical protein